MEFKTIQEAFNHYRKHNRAALDTRAAEIRSTLETDGDANVQAFNIEIEGIMQVIKDIDEPTENGGDDAKRSNNLNPILSNQGFNAAAETRGNVYSTSEYRSAFFKKMLGKDLNEVETRAFNEADNVAKTETRAALTSGDAGAVLPTETLNEVIRKARDKGGLMQEVRSFNMPTGIKIPIGTPATAAEWHVEGEEVEPDDIGLASVKFDGYEIVKIFSLSVKVKTMSISAFESYLIEELTAAVMETIAISLVKGTGVEQGTGLETGITWTAANQVNGAGDFVDFTQALGKLKRGYAAGAKFAMNSATLYSIVYGVLDGNGRPLFLGDATGEGNGRILGKEIILDDYIEDNQIILGDFNYMAYNLPLGITVESSRESSFRSALIDYRAVAVADTKPLVEGAFVKITVAPE